MGEVRVALDTIWSKPYPGRISVSLENRGILRLLAYIKLVTALYAIEYNSAYDSLLRDESS